MRENRSNRGVWGSKIGFTLAAAGSAIGLGNIWLFPTVAGQNGGAAFVLIYGGCVLLIGVPVMIAELSLGRRAQSDPVGTFKSLAPKTWWKAVGALGVFTGFMILSAYTVVAGWTLKYILITVSGQFAEANPESIGRIFTEFVGDGFAVLLYHFVFMALTVWIVIGGIEKGIEKATKILMPLLFGLLLLLVLRSVTLQGALEGVTFYLYPDFSKVTFGVIMAALGQAFFSLSLGMGAMITYGSYLSRNDNLVSSALYVSLFDTLIAFLAGFAIFPALFSVSGLSPTEGASLIFLVLPNIFNAIPLGQLFGAAFFFLLAIAALTSTISLLEVVVAYFIDQLGWQRKRAALLVGSSAFLLGIPSALSSGSVSFLSQLWKSGQETLSLMDLVFLYFGKISLAVGALLICLFVGWKWGIRSALKEIRSGYPSFALAPLWTFLVRYACPVAIAIILASYFRS
ncbi:sodium-dependent transporter [Acidobacteria bacterium AH-259-A15]|nr:sodium-dependent transporter [Acidobacteria bacterium AH-259-A15]